jgi:hypothetical protein
MTHSLSLSDHLEQITFVAVIHNDVETVALLYHLVQRHNVWMPAGKLVQCYLAALEMSLTRIEPGAEEALDGDVRWGLRLQVYG